MDIIEYLSLGVAKTMAIAKALNQVPAHIAFRVPGAAAVIDLSRDIPESAQPACANVIREILREQEVTEYMAVSPATIAVAEIPDEDSVQLLLSKYPNCLFDGEQGQEARLIIVYVERREENMATVLACPTKDGRLEELGPIATFPVSPGTFWFTHLLRPTLQ